MLTHEEWVNGGRYESLFARGRPTNPARDTSTASRNPPGVTLSEPWYYARLKVAQLALKVEAQRMALDEDKGRLLDAQTANAAIDEIAGALRDALLNWPARVSGLTAADLGADPHLVQTVLQQHVTNLLTEAANRFDPPGIGGRTDD